MAISELKQAIPSGFDSPTALPQTDAQNEAWQEANRSWWETHPMRYDFSESVKAEEFTPEFYQEIDKRFFSDVRTFMPWKEVPFDPLIDFSSLREKDVLEIGVGNGSHAQLISPFTRSYIGIDLTEYAVKSTTERIKLLKKEPSERPAEIMRMDAEHMKFADSSFDFVWSWGVIHHSANTRRILEEIHRVLRPSGLASIMVYHRNFWSYYLFAGLFGGLLRGRLPMNGGVHKARQQLIDGAIARYYTRTEWQALVSDLFEITETRIYGSKSELLPMPNGRIKKTLRSLMPDSLARLLTNDLQMGMFLVSTLRKSSQERSKHAQ